MRVANPRMLAVVLSLVILVLDLQVPLGVACGILYIVVILVAEFTRETRFIMSMAVLSSVFIVVGYYGSPEGGAVWWMVIVNRFLSVVAVWTTTVLVIRINSMHATELQSLSGLLPICAWCKKIRDDQGYWNHLESYLKAHKHMDFSHSICPACVEEQLKHESQK